MPDKTEFAVTNLHQMGKTAHVKASNPFDAIREWLKIHVVPDNRTYAILPAKSQETSDYRVQWTQIITDGGSRPMEAEVTANFEIVSMNDLVAHYINHPPE